jgi:hypothetical protein
MKKLFITAMILSISGSLLLSCSKSSTTPSTPVVITGYWLGSYSSATNSGVAGTAFDSSGNAIVYNFGTSGLTDTATCPLKYTGRYTVTGNQVNFTVTTPSLVTLNYKSTANISVNPNTIAGTFSANGGVSGNFSVTKQ